MWQILQQLGGLLGLPGSGPGILGGPPPMSTPPFNPAGGGAPGVPSAAPPPAQGGFMGRVNSALAPFGGTLPVGVALLANSSGGGSFGSNLGRALAQSAMYNNQQQDRARDARRDEMLMRRYESEEKRYQAEEKERTASQRHRNKLNSILSDPGAYEEGALERTLGKAYGRDPLATALLDRQIGGGSRASLPEVESAYERARAEGYNKDFMTFAREYSEVRRGPQTQPQGTWGQPFQGVINGQAGLYRQNSVTGEIQPVSVGGSIAAPPAAADGQPTEGERNSSGYLGRMQAAEKLLGDYTPSIVDYTAATNLMAGGPARASISNYALSEKGQQYFQAASDWVRAKLRRESGAVINPEEMAQEIKTYFPVPGDSKATIEQKRQARQQAEQQLRTMGGRAVEPSAGSGGDDIETLLKKYGAR